MGLYTDEYFVVPHSDDFARLMRIASALPIELQMILSHRMAGYYAGATVVKSSDFDISARWLLVGSIV